MAANKQKKRPGQVSVDASGSQAGNITGNTAGNTASRPGTIVVLALVSAGLLGIFFTSFFHVSDGLDLVIHAHGNAQSGEQRGNQPEMPPGAMGGAGMGGMGEGMDQKSMARISELMAAYQKNQNDGAVLMELGEVFMHSAKWQQAAGFFKKTVELDPKNLEARYLLGISLYSLGDPTAAAACFEELLAMGENDRAAFNLALLYRHNLGKTEEGEALLRKILASPTAAPELKAEVQAELDTNKTIQPDN